MIVGSLCMYVYVCLCVYVCRHFRVYSPYTKYNFVRRALAFSFRALKVTEVTLEAQIVGFLLDSQSVLPRGSCGFATCP